MGCSGTYVLEPMKPISESTVKVIGSASDDCVFVGVVSTEERDADEATSDLLKKSEKITATHLILGGFSLGDCGFLTSCTTMSGQAYVCGEAAKAWKPPVKDPYTVEW